MSNAGAMHRRQFDRGLGFTHFPLRRGAVLIPAGRDE